MQDNGEDVDDDEEEEEEDAQVAAQAKHTPSGSSKPFSPAQTAALYAAKGSNSKVKVVRQPGGRI